MKIRNDYLVIAAVFAALLFLWHNRADLLDIASAAKQRTTELTKECGQHGWF